MFSTLPLLSLVSMTSTDLSQFLSDKGIEQPSGVVMPANDINNKLNQLCCLVLQLTEEQRRTNTLLQRMLMQEGSPEDFKLVKLGNPDKPYIRYLIVLESERSKPRIDCPICKENVEVTTAKRGGCKQQSFCGDYVVCNECSNDALQKILRCPSCCELYSNISVPICEHLAATTESEGHLARKGSGSGCPLCSNKLVKDKCPQNCSRKDLNDYNMAKTILADKIFVLVKNPEACIDDSDRPCSHYCRCTKHNILFTNRNKGAKCRECTKESSKQRQLPLKRKKPSTNNNNNNIHINQSNSVQTFTSPKSNSNQIVQQPHAKRFCAQSPPPPPCLHSNQNVAQPLGSHTQSIPTDLQSFGFLDQQIPGPHQATKPPGMSEEAFSYWPFPHISFPNVKELGRKVPNFDEIFERIPYSEGVVELGKRVGLLQEEDDDNDS